MRRGCYKKVSREEKVRIVSLVLAGKGIYETAKSTGTADTTLRMWLANETINPDKEYALKFREEHSWLGMKKKAFKEVDPSLEGIEEVTTTNPIELKKENKDLRKKIAYLEDKVRYLETLYSLISTSPTGASRKKTRIDPYHKREK